MANIHDSAFSATLTFGKYKGQTLSKITTMIETEFGFFIGGDEIVLVGPKVRTVYDIIYVEPDGVTQHRVPDGFVYDGASVPRWAWTIIGHPFIRPFRRAAALHDYHCRYENISSKHAHKLFFYALRSEGVSAWRAQLMYRAVLHFGPRFEPKSIEFSLRLDKT